MDPDACAIDLVHEHSGKCFLTLYLYSLRRFDRIEWPLTALAWFFTLLRHVHISYRGAKRGSIALELYCSTHGKKRQYDGAPLSRWLHKRFDNSGEML